MNLSTRGIQRGIANIIWVALVLVAIVLINLIVGRTINRLDLTRDKRYTLSEPSIRAAQNLEGEVTVEAFFSTNLPPMLEQTRRDINDMLADYAAWSEGRLTYQFVDPGASEEDRERADGFDLPAWPLEQASESELSVRYVYSGIALVYDDGTRERVETIPQILPGMNYEYEITRALRQVTSDQGVATLGVVYGDGGMFDELLQVPLDPNNPMAPDRIKNEIESQLAQIFDNLYEFELVDITEGEIPEYIKGLFIIGPTAPYDEDMKYRLDQYLMRGHPVALFVSPYRQETPAEFRRQGFPEISIPSPNDIGLDELLESYGVKLNRDAVVDFERPQVSAQRQEGRMGRMTMIQWVPFLDPRLPEITNIDEASVLVPNLNLIGFPPTDRATPLSQSTLSLTAQAVEARQAGTLVVTEVLRSSDTSFRFVSDDQNRYESIRLADIEPYLPTETEPNPEMDLEQGPFPIAITLEGRFQSALPDPLEAQDEPENEADESDYIDQTDEGRLLVVSNAYWIEALLTGQDPLLSRGTMMMLPARVRNTVQQYRASNILFLRNIADWLAQESDLVRIRSRGQVAFLDTVEIDDTDKKFYQVFNIAGIPGIFCLLGVGGFFVRRMRKSRISQQYLSEK